MEKSRIIEILESWNFWKQKPKIGILRKEYLEKMNKFSETGQVVSLTGARRSGKSTLMLQFINDLITKGLKPENTLYLNLEDPRFSAELSLKLLEDIYESYLEYLKPDEKPYIFLDEIQNIKQWEKFVRYFHEKKLAKIFVSGSTSQLLSLEFGATLTGRHLSIIVYPLNFSEFLIFKKIKIRDELDLIHKKNIIKRALREYLKFGGFPQVVLSDQKQEILAQYFEDIIFRDIIGRHQVKKIEMVKSLANYYMTNISSLISFRRIEKFLKIPFTTIERLSSYFSTSYLLFYIKKFAFSLKEQEINPKKIFAIDLGLREAVSFKFSQDIGKVYENAVFLNLLSRGREIYYWKNKKECDFVIKKEAEKELIQVCYDFENFETKEREIKGLIEAMEKFRLKKGLIITQDFEGKEKIKKQGLILKFIPLWKWLPQP